jgi:hypothetical protein
MYEPYIDEQGRELKHPESLYGNTKMWAHLNHFEGTEVTKCTVERLKKLKGWEGARMMSATNPTLQSIPRSFKTNAIRRQPYTWQNSSNAALTCSPSRARRALVAVMTPIRFTNS